MKKLISMVLLSIVAFSCSEDLTPPSALTTDVRLKYEEFVAKEIRKGTDLSTLESRTVDFMIKHGGVLDEPDEDLIHVSAKAAPEGGGGGGGVQEEPCVITRNSESLKFPDGSWCFVYSYSSGCAICGGGFSVSWWGKGFVDLGENYNCPSGNYYVPPLDKK